MEVGVGAGGDGTCSEGSAAVSWRGGAFEIGPQMGGPGLTPGGGTVGWDLG